MTMSDIGIDRLVADIQRLVETDLRASFDGKWAESPIERLFVLSLKYVARLDRSAATYVHSIYEGTLSLAASVQPHEILIVPQCEILEPYRVDFLLVAADSNGKTHTAVIECDGHDFHERTKEQAQRDRKRDRRLQAAGHRVFRFTGSEIYRNPTATSREVLEWAESVWYQGDAE
jgi:very-short-patch-repair endonuclease